MGCLARVLPIVMLAACSRGEPKRVEPVALSHEAYVWQRAWTGAVREAVANAQPELSGLRVLTLEVAADGSTRSPAVDAASLRRASRPITAVVRIDGSRIPGGLSMAAVTETVSRWRAAGVPVAGIEIDHDCATAALAEYGAWLRSVRPAGMRLSITALPTWATAPRELAALVTQVDEVVLQVHAVRAPTIFDPTAARRDLERFARIVRDVNRCGSRVSIARDGREPNARVAAETNAAAPRETRLRVALPTYRVALGEAKPDDVASFVRSLEQRPVDGVTGIVWFRLPVAADRTAWSAPVLAAVIRGAPHAYLEETAAHVR